MIKITELTIGNEFYFPSNKGMVYIFIEFIYKADNTIQAAKCVLLGKLYPIYISAKHAIRKINPLP